MKKQPTFTFRLEEDFYDKLSDLTDVFLADGFKTFKKEFANIDTFLKKAKADKSKREDQDFRLNPKEMYLLEALNYQVMDRANREAFNKAKDTVIIMPDCMALMEKKCKREKSIYGKVCTRCASKCQINQIVKVALKYKVQCVFSKRKLAEQIEKIKKRKPSLSVIGIACLLTLADGMRTAKQVGVPARGVFLHYTGCEHWATKEPIVTETSLARLEAILKEKYGTPNKKTKRR